MTTQSMDPTIYHGRAITEIGETDGGEPYVELEGGIKIVSFNPRFRPPELLKPGDRFGATRLATEKTTLIFNPGQNQILYDLDPVKYAIIDETGDHVVQQRSDLSVHTPQHPDEREGWEPSGPAIHDPELMEPVETDMSDFEDQMEEE